MSEEQEIKVLEKRKQDLTLLNSLLKFLLALENERIRCEKIISNYDAAVKPAMEHLEELRSLVGQKIGYVPSQKELDEASQRVTDLSFEAMMCEEKLPEIEQKIKKTKLDIADQKRKMGMDEEKDVLQDVGLYGTRCELRKYIKGDC